ncbi:hypothetical protein [Sinorhizobium glycinis]|uniref:hypothetical protein n=1 Tax=Sinorhizobium glycinis TaxID=1472378 RepID=UPI000B1B5539|nr:hypothetical protein [Sinorhizobium glycinis]
MALAVFNVPFRRCQVFLNEGEVIHAPNVAQALALYVSERRRLKLARKIVTLQ